MVGEKDVVTLTGSVMDHLAIYTKSQVGAFYEVCPDSTLELKSGYAYKLGAKAGKIDRGEGIVGQVALSKKLVMVSNLEAEDFLVTFGTAEIKPRHIVAFPVVFENDTKGVIELGSMEEYTPREIELFNSVSESIGVAVNTSQSRARLQELLEETQAQSEELQAQHSELENLNAELEAQTEKLQASEEELKVQQEELTEANQELQERSRLLEDKNKLVLDRNTEIQQKSEELTLSAKYKSEFLANMSHELRTPLNSILLLSRLLGENQDKNLRDDQVEYARVIQSSGNSLLLLIDDILDLSKIESGKMDLEYETVPLEEIAEDMKMVFEPLAREKRIDFSIRIEDGVPPLIETDKLRLEQIIKNLLSNAIKFTGTGSVALSLARSPLLDDFIDFKVTDSGIGIPLEKQRMIFEAFQQADGSTRRKYGGTGLGLSISRQLAFLLKGDITLKSEPGEGSVFTLSIPTKKDIVIPANTESISGAVAAEKPVPAVVPAAEPIYISTLMPQSIPDDRERITLDDKVILIIEDDVAFATALLEFTRRKGYKGVVSVRGDEGIDLAKKFRPAGILLDIQLPVKSGWQVMEEIKGDKQTRHIPVHIMSSFEAKKQSLLSGAIDFINKPMAAEQMNSIFEKIEFYLKKDSKKVLIIEDNSKHAEALSYFLSSHKISSLISGNIDTGLEALSNKEVDCVILDMGIPDEIAYEALEVMKINKGLENIPVIIFTGKNLSRTEEMRIKKYADSIVVKTAHSYRRILDEVSLFLHIVEENKKTGKGSVPRLRPLEEVLRNKTVLVADDDVRNIFSLTRVLEQHHMQVIPAINGKEALEVVKHNKQIDIVLMDMMMPELDGYEAIMAIRKIPGTKELPVIAVTAKAMSGDREKCIQAGASDYISKPVDMDQLISLLRIWLYDSLSKK
jgi:signal transduction histidine kinase/DNA-binding response OmpR family regulator